MHQTSRTIRVSVAAALGLVSVGASAAPAITSILTTYSAQGQVVSVVKTDFLFG